MGLETIDGVDCVICDYCGATVSDLEIPRTWAVINAATARRKLPNEFMDDDDILLCAECKGKVRYTRTGGIEERTTKANNGQMPLPGLDDEVAKR